VVPPNEVRSGFHQVPGPKYHLRVSVSGRHGMTHRLHGSGRSAPSARSRRGDTPRPATARGSPRERALSDFQWRRVCGEDDFLKLFRYLVIESLVVVPHQGMRWVVIFFVENDGYVSVFRGGFLRFSNI
jgi:hypothetical protein